MGYACLGYYRQHHKNACVFPQGTAAAWRALERKFSPLTGGEQISLIGKFFTAKQKWGQDPKAFYQQFNSTVTSLEMAFDQPIPKMLVHARFLDALLPEYEIQKQQLLSQKSLEKEEILRVLRTRAEHLKVGVEEKGGGGAEHARVRSYGRKRRGGADEAK